MNPFEPYVFAGVAVAIASVLAVGAYYLTLRSEDKGRKNQRNTHALPNHSGRHRLPGKD